MADAEFNFQRCSFISELHILQIFLLPKYSDQKKFLDLYQFFSKMEYI